MIEARGLSKSYQSGTRTIEAVNNVDLCVGEGEFVVVEGVSGSGKSTLLYLLGGLLRPTTGSILIGGVDLTDLSEKRRTCVRRNKVGFVFQSFNLIETLSAHDNIELAMVPTGLNSRERRTRAEELLETVGMQHRSKHVPGRLSGGEQQRVAIARALANTPSIILADEPTGDLDSETGRTIVAMLKALTRDAKTTAIIATHSPYVAEHATIRFQMLDGCLHSSSAKPAFS